MDCDRCGNAAVHTRRYSGTSLCSACFSGSISKKAARAISKHSMIRAGDLVAVAVSGGKDSLALLKVLHEMSAAHRFEVRAITIDEGIPGYRDEALGIVEGFCGGLGVEFGVYSYADLFDVTLDEALGLRDQRTSSCSICGTLRRRAMDVAASEIGADSIATGHNLDDMLQTFLINMLSGDTAKIGWMGPGGGEGRPRKIKPFCEIYESEVAFYAFTNGIPFQAEPCPHMGEGVRDEVRRFLNSLEEGHSGVKNNLYRSAMRLSGMASGHGGKRRSECPGCGSPCTGPTCSVCSVMAGLRGPNPNANIT